ncbi:MAG: iron-containing alcohol dehydrogenase, partial [Actinoallomurus sp.]
MSLSQAGLTLSPMPAAHLGAGTVRLLGELAQTRRVLVVTDPGIAATPVLDAVRDALAGCEVTVFTGVHANPTTDDIAGGAVAAQDAGAETIVALGGGSAMDAAKGIAVATVNPQRGRDLDYRSEFAAPALRIIAVP